MSSKFVLVKGVHIMHKLADRKPEAAQCSFLGGENYGWWFLLLFPTPIAAWNLDALLIH